jgi:protein TonB
MTLRMPFPAATAVALLVGAGLLAGCGEEPPRERRMQTVKLLPDTPPPPPPPPPKDKPPEPPPQAKPQPQLPDNKPPESDAAQLKSDEAAGDGPGNGLVAGPVTQDYSNQALGGAVAIGGSGDDAAARLAAESFARSTTRSLNEFLAREQSLKRSDYRTQVQLWLAPDGAVQRAELVGSTGDGELDRALRDSLLRFRGPSAPPQALRQPLRLQVTNRMLG